MATEFCTRSFVRSHGKQPKGFGVWAFDVGGEWHFTPRAMTFTDAKAWIRPVAQAAGQRMVEVGP